MRRQLHVECKFYIHINMLLLQESVTHFKVWLVKRMSVFAIGSNSLTSCFPGTVPLLHTSRYVIVCDSVSSGVITACDKINDGVIRPRKNGYRCQL